MGIKNLISILEQRFPLSTQESWDNSGWQIKLPSPNSTVQISVDISEVSLINALNNKASLIITHHPFFFNPLKKIDMNKTHDKLLCMLIQNNISLYSLHTPIDSGDGGIADFWAKIFNIQDSRPIEPKEHLFKLITYIPKTHFEEVRKGIFGSIPKNSDKYEECSFHSAGEGRFTPINNANPFKGTINKMECVEEFCLEIVIKKENIHNAINALKKSHPYETPAYEIIPLHSANIGSKNGLGRKGNLAKSMTLDEIIEILKTNGITNPTIGGKVFDSYDKISILPGAGKSMLHKIDRKSIYITSDLGYHDAQFAGMNDFTVINTSHYEIERVFIPIIKNITKEEKIEINLIEAEKDIDYFTF